MNQWIGRQCRVLNVGSCIGSLPLPIGNGEHGATWVPSHEGGWALTWCQLRHFVLGAGIIIFTPPRPVLLHTKLPRINGLFLGFSSRARLTDPMYLYRLIPKNPRNPANTEQYMLLRITRVRAGRCPRTILNVTPSVARGPYSLTYRITKYPSYPQKRTKRYLHFPVMSASVVYILFDDVLFQILVQRASQRWHNLQFALLTSGTIINSWEPFDY